MQLKALLPPPPPPPFLPLYAQVACSVLHIFLHLHMIRKDIPSFAACQSQTTRLMPWWPRVARLPKLEF
ncbi:hypothetical protein AOLI_G00201720 [Acnodon oligacanthus]